MTIYSQLTESVIISGKLHVPLYHYHMDSDFNDWLNFITDTFPPTWDHNAKLGGPLIPSSYHKDYFLLGSHYQKYDKEKETIAYTITIGDVNNIIYGHGFKLIGVPSMDMMNCEFHVPLNLCDNLWSVINSIVNLTGSITLADGSNLLIRKDHLPVNLYKYQELLLKKFVAEYIANGPGKESAFAVVARYNMIPIMDKDWWLIDSAHVWIALCHQFYYAKPTIFDAFIQPKALQGDEIENKKRKVDKSN